MKSKIRTHFPFHCSIERSFEHGLILNWFFKTNEGSLARIMKNVKVHRSIEEYTEDLSNSLHAEIKFENLSRAFFFYFLVLGGISIGYTITWYHPQTKRHVRIISQNVQLGAIEHSERIKLRIARFSVVHWLKERGSLIGPIVRNSTCSALPEADQDDPTTNLHRSSSL